MGAERTRLGMVPEVYRDCAAVAEEGCVTMCGENLFGALSR